MMKRISLTLLLAVSISFSTSALAGYGSQHGGQYNDSHGGYDKHHGQYYDRHHDPQHRRGLYGETPYVEEYVRQHAERHRIHPRRGSLVDILRGGIEREDENRQCAPRGEEREGRSLHREVDQHLLGDRGRPVQSQKGGDRLQP